MSNQVAAEFLAAWARTHSAGDIDELVSLYLPDALFFGSAPALAEGHDAIRGYFTQLTPHEDPSVDFEVLATRPLAPGVLEVASLGTFRWSGNPGVPIRFTHTLVERDGAWLAAVHHASPL